MPENLQTQPDPAMDFAAQLAGLAADTRCVDVIVLDVRARSPVTRFFVISTGTSARQIRTVADELTDLGKKANYPAWRTSGYEAARWILVDFVDVVAHVFDELSRNFYDLELLWGDCPKVDWRAMLGRQAESATIQTTAEIPYRASEEYPQTEETEPALNPMQDFIGEALGPAGDTLEEFIEEDVVVIDIPSQQTIVEKSGPGAIKPRKSAGKKSAAKKAPAKTRRKTAAKKTKTTNTPDGVKKKTSSAKKKGKL
ncbi:MAG TPA: ribosome silencing factor [Phycisphaerae bacterium]|nr:ribosome silencing factor [Phycisphaerae bacterium]